MLVSSLVFLTPAAALVAVAVLVPIAGLVLAARRVRQVRAALGLTPPAAASRLPHVAAVAAVPLLLALGATQPALRSGTGERVRTDAQAIFVVDVSRSMQASSGPGRPTRLARAKLAAIALRAEIPTVPSGIVTFTDRVLPSLLPDADPSVFDNTMRAAVLSEEPPPEDENVIATTLGALGALGTQNYFTPAAKVRLVVVLTDGESRPFDAGSVAHALGAGPGIKLVLVHISAAGELVYDGSTPESGYREPPDSGQALSLLADAAGARVFSESSLGAAGRDERTLVGTGPTVVEGRTQTTRALAPYVLLLALLPLLLAMRLHAPLRRRAVGEPSPMQAAADDHAVAEAPVTASRAA